MLAVLGSMLSVIPVKAQGPIQTLVNIANPGDTINVGPGTYNEHVIIPSSKTGITIKGHNAILDGLGCSLPDGFEIVGTDSVTIRGFTIRHYSEAGIYIHANDTAVPRDRAVGNMIRNNVIEDNCGAGIIIGASDANTVKTNTVQHNGRIGVFIDDGLKNRIRSNTIYNNGWSGIEYHIAPNTEVKGNDVTYNGQYGLCADGYSPNSNIRGNTFSYNGLRGIFIISDSNTMIDNTVNNNAYSGIWMGQGDYNWVEKNYVNWNGQDGIEVTHFLGNPSVSNTFTNNTVNHNAYYGIGVYSANLAGLNLIEKNEVAWNGWSGIGIGASANNTIRWNHVHDNAMIGVFIDYGYYNAIWGNLIDHNGWSGIEYHIAAYTQVVDNTVIYNGVDGLCADGYSGFSYIHVNSFNNNGRNGIYMISGSNTITNNYANNNGLEGIFMWQIGFNLIANNQANSNAEDGIRVEDESFNLIQYNEASYNYEYGIVMGSRYTSIPATNNSIEYNTALYQTVGPDLADSTYYSGLANTWWSNNGILGYGT